MDKICKTTGGPACARLGILYIEANRAESYQGLLQLYQRSKPRPGDQAIKARARRPGMFQNRAPCSRSIAIRRELAFKRARQGVAGGVFARPLCGHLAVAPPRLLGALGIIGGLLLGLVAAACGSGYLYLLQQAVRGLPMRFEDLTRGFRRCSGT